MSFFKVNSLLDKSVKRAGIADQVNAANVLEMFSTVLDVHFGPAISRRVKPLYLKQGTLTLACISTVLAQRVKAAEPKLLAVLNSPYQQPVVVRLRFLT